MTVRRKEIWHCTLGNHSKQYVLTLEEIAGRFTLTAEWGRIGAQNLQSKAYVENGSRSAADSMWDRLESEKVGKGYQNVNSRSEDVDRWPARGPIEEALRRPLRSRQDAIEAVRERVQAPAPQPKPVPKKKDSDEDPARKIWL